MSDFKEKHFRRVCSLLPGIIELKTGITKLPHKMERYLPIFCYGLNLTNLKLFHTFFYSILLLVVPIS